MSCPNCDRELPEDITTRCYCGMCRVCGWRHSEKAGRCDTCYRYWRRHGSDRGWHLMRQEADRIGRALAFTKGL